MSRKPENIAAIAEAAGGEVRSADTLKALTDALLWEDTTAVVIDTDHPETLEAARLVVGTRWDVRLLAVGKERARAERGGATVVSWDDLPAAIAG